MTADIIPIKEMRRARLRRALDEWRDVKELFIEKTLALAFELKAARDECGQNDTAFGIWLVENKCDDILTKDERMAAIKMAEHSDISRQEMERTGNQNVEWLWRKHIKPRVDALTYLSPQIGAEIVQLTEIPQKETPMPPPEQNTIPIPNSTMMTNPVKPHRGRLPGSINKRSHLYGRTRAAEVNAIYRSRQTISVIGKLLQSYGSSELWQMILTAIDAGFLTTTNYSVGGHNAVTLRILYPDERARGYCLSVHLETAQERKRARDVILPLMVENKDAILADPARIGQIMHKAEYDLRLKNSMAVTERLATERKAAMPKHESEIVIYGETFWPNPQPDVRSYSYDQCLAACWYFHETDQLYKSTVNGHDIKGRAMLMRFSTRWFSQYADRDLTGDAKDKIKRVFQLVHAMANAMQQNPEGESRRPPAPTNEGEWV